jgi:peroxiredoxin Q/BCP
MLAQGEQAPDIELQTDTGDPFTLSANRGRKVVLYFYPKADTPGCTTEACEFRDLSKKFAKKNAVIVGISPDAVRSQLKFKGKYELPFTLLADVDKAAAEAYGVWKEKNMYGKKVMGIERTTFIIDEEGRIAKIFPKVKAQGHAEQVLAAL